MAGMDPASPNSRSDLDRVAIFDCFGQRSESLGVIGCVERLAHRQAGPLAPFVLASKVRFLDAGRVANDERPQIDRRLSAEDRTAIPAFDQDRQTANMIQ